MPNPHQKHRQKPKTPARPPDSPRAEGLRLFRGEHYTEAIQQWSRIEPKDDAVTAALAEAHFRRALSRRQDSAAALADLWHTVELRPGDARCWYHLGLALHRADQLDDARAAYARASDLGLRRSGFGFVRGLAEVEIAPETALEALAWLTPDDRAALAPIAALLRKEPGAAPVGAAPGWLERLRTGRSEGFDGLWRGLACLMAGDSGGARAALALPKGRRLPAGAEPIRAFYHALAAAAAGDLPPALAEWGEAAREAARTAPAILPHLTRAIADARARSIAELLSGERWSEALELAQSALKESPDDDWLLRAALVAAHRLADEARRKDDWAAAIARWQSVRGILEAHPGLGPLPPLLRSLAVAHERIEQWEEAAESWAALLRALPRRSAKKGPVGGPGVPADAQRPWLRRRIVDDYRRAGLPDQAISYYKQAVKADPDNLDLRLEMASALLANDQTIAARNEVGRILEKDPGHVEALMLQATIHGERGEWYAIEGSLRRILEIDPQHEAARRGLAQSMLGRGVSAFNAGSYRDAKRIYTDALHYAPDDPQILVFLAEAEFALRHASAGRKLLEDALATGKAEAYRHVFASWVRQKNETEARGLIARAESADAASPRLYIDAGIACFTYSAPPPPRFGPPTRSKPKAETVWERWGRELIDKGLSAMTSRGDVLRHIVASLGPQHAPVALEYARQLVAATPDDPQASLTLALFQAINGEAGAARDSLNKAERLARKQGQKDLLDEIAEMRYQIGSPVFGLLGSLLTQFGPEILEELDDEGF